MGELTWPRLSESELCPPGVHGGAWPGVAVRARTQHAGVSWECGGPADAQSLGG